jgi:hypothetical protein
MVDLNLAARPPAAGRSRVSLCRLILFGEGDGQGSLIRPLVFQMEPEVKSNTQGCVVTVGAGRAVAVCEGEEDMFDEKETDLAQSW